MCPLAGLKVKSKFMPTQGDGYGDKFVCMSMSMYIETIFMKAAGKKSKFLIVV